MLEGHLLSERYRIKQTIGGGGMANVYLAHDTILDRDVAIKVLRLEFANDPEFIERFDREAQAATSLSHPNIVNIYDVGEEAHILYIVMEYVEGMTLKEYIQKNGPLDVAESVEIMKQLTDAIAHAHTNGLIHRDIKPQNVLMDKYGNVKVTDFGIAIALSATSLTQTNSIMGSVHYLSPEQARGGMATKKSDIYALGIVFYELLTGELPFSGQSPISIALKHLQDDTPSVRKLYAHIPQSVENIVLKATAKDPFHRYRNVYDMEEALNKALDPNYIDQAMYHPPMEDGEETKAIPIITDEQLHHAVDGEDTLVHNERQVTKKMPEEAPTPLTTEKKKKKRFYKRKGFIFTLLFLLLLMGAFAVYLFLLPKDVSMPDVVGESFEDAEATLEGLKLTVNKELMPSDDIKEGEVIKTDPVAGRKVKEKTTVDVFVSNGKKKVSFEDYVGENFNQVKRILEDAGYKEIIPYPKTSDAPEGEIISQISPQKGVEVVPSETQVIFEISGGPEKVSVGRLTGLSLKEAQKYADETGLKLDVSEAHSNSVAEGDIMSQDPEAGKEVTIGSTIKVVQSIGPEKLPPKSHSVTFTIPYHSSGDEEGEEAGQSVQIYVDDMNNDITDVFHEEMITEDEEYTLTLVIEPGKTAEYKVVSDGDVILNRTVKYEEGE
jgi:serine/threonine-protein kinase